MRENVGLTITSLECCKGEHPKAWWKGVKRLSGMQSRSLLSKLDIIEIQDRNAEETANTINKAFPEPLGEYRSSLLTPLPLEDCPKFLEVTEERTYKLLSRLNPAKATGPDGLPNWLLREFASLVAFSVKTILNASFSEQRLPSSWKYADVTPLPKKMPVQNLKKDLRPISLTPCPSKVAEDFVVTDHLRPAVMKVLDSN